MRTIRTAETRARFLEAVRKNGNVTQVCDDLGLTRSAIYTWRDEDPAFRDAWEDAMALGVDALEDEARRRAFAGSDLLMIFMLKGAKPDKYRDRSTVDVHQTIKHDLRSVPMPELRKRLEQLRIEQAAYETDLAARDGQGPLIEGNVVELHPEKPGDC